MCLLLLVFSAHVCVSASGNIESAEESYPRFDLWSHTRDQEHTTADFFTATELRDQRVHELPSGDRLLRAVDKLPFKTMTPSSLLLEDLYFTPSAHKLVDYSNAVIHQPRVNCSGSELLLILVPSHPGAGGVRRAIRETWGSVARGRSWPGRGGHFAVKLVFVLGVAEASFQPGTLHNAQTVGKQQLNTQTVDRQQLNTQTVGRQPDTLHNAQTVGRQQLNTQTVGSQPGTIHNAQTVGKQQLNTQTVDRQQLNTHMLTTDTYLTRNQERTFPDRDNKASSVLMTKHNNIMNWFYEKTGHAHRQNVDELTNVPGIQNVHELTNVPGIQNVHELTNVPGIQNVNNNRNQDSLQMWGHRTRTWLSNKPHMEADMDTLSLNPDQSPQTAPTAAHTDIAPDSNSEIDLVEEMSAFGDILQFDMIDTYSNLTRKIVLSLQLLLKTCSTVRFILKVDPDIFVNVPLLATFLSRRGDRNSVYGRIYPNSVVTRTGKWAVAKTALPIPKYPIYAAGNAYVVSTDAVKTMVELASRFPYVLVEDAFITGILASVGRINRVNVAGFTKWTEPRPDPCDFVTDKLYVGNNFTEYHLRVFWREIVDRGGYRCDV